ncbi:MAG: cupin domain-containing protein [Defluviitaleaceae bacterium]|nr:cupin domain-containing protein [Defluviitaleaceae bacterium]
MKDLIIKNINDIQSENLDRGNDNVFSIKRAIPENDQDKCFANFIEIPPGKYAYSYHYHEHTEEVFYILSGEGSLRTYEGEKIVKAGDMCCFPTGEKGAHLLRNISKTEVLKFIDFGAYGSHTEIVTYPDTNQYLLIGPHIGFKKIDGN